MRKEFSFGKIAYTGKSKSYAVTLEVELDDRNPDKPVFTVSGDVWNTKHTDIVWGGQCVDKIWDNYKNQLSNRALYEKIMWLWKCYHLNNMNAGCMHQQAMNWNNGYIGKTCPVCGYKYGTAWLYKPIMEDDLQEIKTLLGMS